MPDMAEQYALVESWITVTCDYIMDKQFYFLGIWFSWYDVIIAGGIFTVFGTFLWDIVLKFVDAR